MLDNDVLMNSVIMRCLKDMEGASTLGQVTICYNLLERVIRLCCVCVEEEDVKNLCKKLHEQLLKDIEKAYE